jgi:hypothetical protein
MPAANYQESLGGDAPTALKLCKACYQVRKKCLASSTGQLLNFSTLSQLDKTFLCQALTASLTKKTRRPPIAS